MIEVELPNGQIVEFPDNTADDVIKSALGKYAKSNKPAPDGSLPLVGPNAGTIEPYQQSLFERAMTSVRGSGVIPGSNIQDFRSVGAAARSAGNAATFGFGDEIRAAGNSLTGVGGEQGFDSYGDNLKRQEARTKFDKATRTTATTLGTVGGSVAGGAGVVKSGLNLLKNAKTLPQAIGLASADGTLYGALSGAGHAEQGERLSGGTRGAISGGIVGAGSTALLGGAPVLAGAVKSKIQQNIGTLESQATARIASALKGNPQAATALDDLGSESALMDVMGERGRAMARSASNASPEAREALEGFSNTRMAGQPDRLTDKLLAASGLKNPQSVDEIMGAAQAQARPNINQAYEKARALGHDINPAQFDDIFQSQIASKANKSGQRLAQERLIAEGGVGKPSQLSVLDETKKTLDGLGQPNLGQPQTNEQAIASLLAKRVRDRTDQALPEYGGARQLAQNLRQQEDAISLGAQGAKPRVASDFSRQVGDVSPEFKGDVAQGYASGKIDQILNKRSTAGVTDALFGSPRQQEALRSALGPRAAGVEGQITIEKAFANTHKALTGNSTTARQMAEMGLSSATGAGLGYAAGGDMQSAGAGAIAGALMRKGVPAMTQRISANKNAALSPLVAQLLMGRKLPEEAVKSATGNPAVRQMIIEALINKAGAQ